MYHTTVAPRTPGHRTRDCQDQGLEEISPDYHVQRDLLVRFLLSFFLFLLATTLLLSLLSKIASRSSRTELRRFFCWEERAPRPRANSASRSACSLVKSASSFFLRSSSFSFYSRAQFGRKDRAEESRVSLAANCGAANDGPPSEVPRRVRSHLCGPATSDRGAGRIPRGRGVGARRPECVSSPASSLPALFSCPHRASCGSTLLALWWSFSATRAS